MPDVSDHNEREKLQTANWNNSVSFASDEESVFRREAAEETFTLTQNNNKQILKPIDMPNSIFNKPTAKRRD